MKLLYLYIGHVGRPLAYHEFSFSDDYLVHFDRENKTLDIRKSPHPQVFAYGENITGLKLLVGKNGCGKSTILSLLGLSPHDLRNEFLQYKDASSPTQEQAYDWFSLYHLEGDLFALEGYNPSVVVKTGFCLQNHYSVSFRYDFTNHQFLDIDVLQESRNPETNQKHVNQLNCLFYSQEPSVPWYARPKRQKSDPYNVCFFPRYDISQVGYYAVEHFLYLAAQKDKEFYPFFDNDPAALTATLKLRRNDINDLTLFHQDNSLAEAIYGSGQSFLSLPVLALEKQFGRQSELSCCHSMVIRYLEELLVFSLKEHPIQNERVFVDQADAGEAVRYAKRRDFLLGFIESLTKTPAPPDSYKNTVMDSYDLYLAKQFCAALEQIPEQFFPAGDQAEIRLSSCGENFLEPLMVCYDQNHGAKEHELNHEAFLAFHIQNLSSGELALIDLYAAILSGIREVNQQADSILLLLDEPDSRLHPEWSRLFLKRLTDLLKSDRFCAYRFQILIATHSPLLLSDVPKKDILCLDASGGTLKVTPANHGFMSNLNDILLDSMFLQSPFGAFAEDYTNRLLQELSRLKETLQASPFLSLHSSLPHRLALLEEKIAVIDEPYLKKVLLKSLRQLRELWDAQTSRKKRIQYLEEELKRLKALEEEP